MFFIAFFFLRGSGEGGGPGDTTLPVGSGPSTTSPAPGTGDPGSVTTVPGGTTTTGNNLPALQGVRLETLAQDLRQPTVLTTPPGDERLFVVERVGVIRILDANRELLGPAFIDLTDRVRAPS
jgi:hypothetical protein